MNHSDLTGLLKPRGLQFLRTEVKIMIKKKSIWIVGVVGSNGADCKNAFSIDWIVQTLGSDLLRPCSREVHYTVINFKCFCLYYRFCNHLYIFILVIAL